MMKTAAGGYVAGSRKPTRSPWSRATSQVTTEGLFPMPYKASASREARTEASRTNRDE